jgi:hypothetical protein
VTALVQGLAPALSDGSRLSWAAPSSLHEGLGFRAMAPDRIQGDAAKPRFDEAQSGIMFAQPRRPLLRPQRASLAPRSPRSSPLRAASGGDLRSGLTAPARGAADSPRSGRRNALRSNKETASPPIRSPLTDGLIQGRGGWAHRSPPWELRLLSELLRYGYFPLGIGALAWPATLPLTTTYAVTSRAPGEMRDVMDFVTSRTILAQRSPSWVN